MNEIKNLKAKVQTRKAIYDTCLITIKDAWAFISYYPAKFLNHKDMIFFLDDMKVDKVPTRDIKHIYILE